MEHRHDAQRVIDVDPDSDRISKEDPLILAATLAQKIGSCLKFLIQSVRRSRDHSAQLRIRSYPVVASSDTASACHAT
jgi:hypothetical protein